MLAAAEGLGTSGKVRVTASLWRWVVLRSQLSRCRRFLAPARSMECSRGLRDKCSRGLRDRAKSLGGDKAEALQEVNPKLGAAE